MIEPNPITAELSQAGLELISPENVEATTERMGGREVVEQLLSRLTYGTIKLCPEIGILGDRGFRAVEAAIVTGLAAGMAAEQRARRGEDLMGGFTL